MSAESKRGTMTCVHRSRIPPMMVFLSPTSDPHATFATITGTSRIDLVTDFPGQTVTVYA
jgi:hypothetical protein